MSTQFPPLSRVSAAEQVYERLRAKVEDGSLVPGEVLADQRIAAELGVSRTPVREALQRLANQGVVETSPGQHTRVAPVPEASAEQVFPLLSLLYQHAAECCAATITEEDLVEMADQNHRMRAAVAAGDPRGARDADRAFHAVSVRRAANPYLDMLVDLVSLHSQRVEAVYFADVEPAEESAREHDRIIAAFRRGDARTAAELVRTNTRRGRNFR